MSDFSVWRVLCLGMVTITMLAGWMAWDATHKYLEAEKKLKSGETVTLDAVIDIRDGTLYIRVNENNDQIRVFPNTCPPQKSF